MSVVALSNDHIQFVCRLVKERSAIDLDANKAYLIEARLGPVAKKVGCSSISELVSKVQSGRAGLLESRIVEAMTTNETSFFRDLHPFEILRTQILPEILRNKKDKKQLNIWSAACSSGQEIYSIAMMLKEHFPQLSGWNVNLLATDLSTEILEKAKAGVFSQIDVNRGLPAQLLTKYFQRQGMNWTLRSDVTQMVTFQKLNLIETWPTLPEMDAVFLRNVLIYFPIDIKRQILEKIRKVMAPGAVLFLGAAETTVNLDVKFKREQVGNTVFYRSL